VLQCGVSEALEGSTGTLIGKCFSVGDSGTLEGSSSAPGAPVRGIEC